MFGKFLQKDIGVGIDVFAFIINAKKINKAGK